MAGDLRVIGSNPSRKEPPGNLSPQIAKKNLTVGE